MKNRLCFDVLKRLFAIVLCAAISVAYLPLLGQGDKVYAESQWQEDVKAIQFIPSGGDTRTVYKILHSDEREEVDEEGEPTGATFDYYYVQFKDGDKIIATLLNGTKKTIIYNASEWEWIYENGSIVNGMVPFFTEPEGEWQDDHHWQIGNTYNACVSFGNWYYEGDDEITPTSSNIRVKVSENPIKSIKFTPSEERADSQPTEAEIIMEGFYYDDIYEYSADRYEGDKLTVTWEDNSKTVYTFDKYEWAFLDSEGNNLEDIARYEHYVEGPSYITNEPFSLNGATFGSITYTITFLGKSDSFVVNVEGSSAEEIAFAEVKSTAINELRNLANSLDWDLYRTAQQNELDKIMGRGFDAIWEATTPAQVKSALNAAKNAIKAVKTNAQLTAEEKDWNGTLSGAVPAAKGVKAKAAKKKVKVSWKKANKKNLKKFDKVEIQVCPDRNFGRANTKRVEVKKSKKSVTVKGLTKGKTYFVRVRNVKGSGQTKLVSKWSGVKKAKIK